MSPSISDGQSVAPATIALPQLSAMPAAGRDSGKYTGLPAKRPAPLTPDFDTNHGRPGVNSVLLSNGPRRGSAAGLYGASSSAASAAGATNNASFSFPMPAAGVSTPLTNSQDYDELNDDDAANGDGFDGDSPGQSYGGKRKIKRIRPLRSCLTCNKRKIKCDRQMPCGPCDKRGEGEKCSLGISIMSGAAATAMLHERISHLEARVEDLEAAQGQGNGVLPEPVTAADASNVDDSVNTARSTAAAIAPPRTESSQDNVPSTSSKTTQTPLASPRGRQQPVTNDATEEAALALESLCRPNLKAPRSSHTTYPNSTSAVHAGGSTIRIDPTIDTNAPLAKRSLDVRMRVFASRDFPDRGLADHLTATYFQHLDPYWHVHINQFFEAEYADFWYIRAENRLSEVDPAWVSLFFVTLALGMQITELPIPQHIQRSDWRTPDDMLAMSDVWVDMAEEMLKAADWIRKPQFRTLQTICLINGYQSMCSLVDPSGAAFNGASIRIAQLMSFHTLQAGTDRMPPDDPAVPPGSNHVKTQLASRLWYSVVVLEHVYAARMGLTLPSASTPYTTTFPLNVDDSDLLADGPLVEKPTWQRTSTSSLHLRWILAKTYNQLLALPVEMPAAEKYQSVLEIDAELRKWLNELPSEPLPKQAGDYAAYKSTLWRQWSSVADVHGQLLHLHRPYMVRGYTDPRFSLSTKVCLESAKIICESRQHLQDSIVDERFWWTTMRWLSACIIIFIDLYQAIDAGMPSEALQRKKADIPHIYAVFQARQKSLYPTTRAFASAAIRVVDNLLDAERVKRTAATRRSSRAGIEVEAEPVGHVFQRIAKTMRSSNGTAAPVLPLPEPAVAPRFIGHGPGRLEGRPHRVLNSLSGIGDNVEATVAQGHVVPDALDYTPPHSATVTTPLGQNRSNSVPSTANHSPMHLTFRTLPPAPNAAGMLTLPSISDNVMLPVMSAITPMLGDASVTSSSTTSSHTHSHAYSSNSSSADSLPTIIPSQSLLKEQSNPTPISWDTSHFFHPDPAVLLRDMGYSGPGAAMLPSSQMYADESNW